MSGTPPACSRATSACCASRAARSASGAQGTVRRGDVVGVTTGQFLSAGVLATLPVGFPAFAILFLVSGAFRVGLIPFVEVSDSWSTATSVWSIDELAEETRRDGPEGPAGA